MRGDGGELRFEFGHPLGQILLLGAGLGGHRLDRFEFVAADEIHSCEHLFELLAQPRFDLGLDARKRAQRARRNARDIVEKPVLALHPRTLIGSGLARCAAGKIWGRRPLSARRAVLWYLRFRAFANVPGPFVPEGSWNTSSWAEPGCGSVLPGSVAAGSASSGSAPARALPKPSPSSAKPWIWVSTCSTPPRPMAPRGSSAR